MASMNSVTLIGHIGRDPEAKNFNGGYSAYKFTVATNRKGKQGEEQVTDWHNVNLLTKFDHSYLKKGMCVCVQGEVRYSTYDDKNGDRKYYTEIFANRVLNLERKGGGQPRNEYDQTQDVKEVFDGGNDLPF